jgi:hypothetical protein
MMESTLEDLGKEKSTEKSFDLGGRIERGRESRLCCEKMREEVSAEASSGLGSKP